LSNSLLVGIDVSLQDNKVRILHPDGTSLSKFIVKNSVHRCLDYRRTLTLWAY
jgi:hypothetical protein